MVISANRTSALLSVAALLAAVAATALASEAQAATWSVATTPNATSQRNMFNGVDAQSASAAWAVGSADTGSSPATRPLVARWNGTSWSQESTPALGSAATLNAVDGNATDHVWAVGAVGAGTLTQRWNGSQWNVVPSPVPAGATDATLRGVKAFGANDAWAVGDATMSAGNFPRRTLLTRWNGTSWSIVPSPSPDPNQNLLTAVDGVAPNDVWVVGNLGHDGYGGDTVAGMMLHWDGSAWTRVPVPGADATFSIIKLRDVVALASDNVWVVGEAFNRQMLRTVPYVLRWNGTGWHHITIPNAPEGGLRGVAALSPNNIYAVGHQNGSRTLIARWNGNTWSQESAPSPGVHSSLNDAFATSTGVVGAVGMQFNSSWVGRTLAIHTAGG
jgi:hypothetical protein